MDPYRLVEFDIDVDDGTDRVRIGVAAHSSAAFRFDWDGDPAGTISLLSSELPNPSVEDDDDWEAISASIDSPDGSADSSSAVITVPHRWLAIKYAGSSGSGTLSAHLTLKR
jgi:hypothetical protein